MRTAYGILIVGLLLFVFGIWFVLAGARTAGAKPAAAPIATVHELMDGIITPASNVVYQSVSTVVTREGLQETAPTTDREWQRLAGNAAALAEAGQLLMTAGRARQSEDWTMIAQAMTDAAMQAHGAAQKKDPEAVLAAGELLNNSCDNCHRKFKVEVE
jgi:thioredoxin-like negative regulator of GroEL